MAILLTSNDKENLHLYGFCKSSLDYDFSNIIKNINSLKAIKQDHDTGYATNLYDKLDSENKELLLELSKVFLEKKIIKDYLKKPKILLISLLKSVYSQKLSVDPTHAMLWHRDLNDYSPELTVMIPLVDINKYNGIFSIASKQVADLSTLLIDKELNKKLSSQNDVYRKEDTIRISDKIFSKHFKDKIYDFDCKLGDVLIVDTHACYHKGGQILEPNNERIMIHFRYGLSTNSHNETLKLNLKKPYLVPYILFIRAKRWLKGVFLKLNGKKNSSIKKYLD